MLAATPASGARVRGCIPGRRGRHSTRRAELLITAPGCRAPSADREGMYSLTLAAALLAAALATTALLGTGGREGP